MKAEDDIIPDWAHSPAGTKYFKELAKDTKGVCFVAEEINGELVGYLAASVKEIDYRKSRYLEIDNMGVKPAYRSKGVGSKLLAGCKQWAKDHGFDRLFVNAYIGNEKAITFYKKFGFETIDISLEMNLE